MTTLPLTFLLPQALAVALVQEVPQLKLHIRQPQALDASLLPVLVGPPGGGAAAAPVSRVLTWDSGRIAGVAFADGRIKTFTWDGDRLSHVDSAGPNQPTLRSELSYSTDGLIQSITVSQLP